MNSPNRILINKNCRQIRKITNTIRSRMIKKINNQVRIIKSKTKRLNKNRLMNNYSKSLNKIRKHSKSYKSRMNYNKC